MDKARRTELSKLKQKKRGKIFNIEGDIPHVFKNHGKPCSCFVCRDEKFRDTKRSKTKIINQED